MRPTLGDSVYQFGEPSYTGLRRLFDLSRKARPSGSLAAPEGGKRQTDKAQARQGHESRLGERCDLSTRHTDGIHVRYRMVVRLESPAACLGKDDLIEETICIEEIEIGELLARRRGR